MMGKPAKTFLKSALLYGPLIISAVFSGMDYYKCRKLKQYQRLVDISYREISAYFPFAKPGNELENLNHDYLCVLMNVRSLALSTKGGLRTSMAKKELVESLEQKITGLNQYFANNRMSRNYGPDFIRLNMDKEPVNTLPC